MTKTPVLAAGGSSQGTPRQGSPAWSFNAGLFVDARLQDAGVRHGVTTRALGDMGDPGRRRAFFGGLGFKDESGLWLKQVHGDRVMRWPEKGSADREPLLADGWIAAAPSRPLCIYTADCAPLFLWESCLAGGCPRFGGVFHVGWRGAASGLPRKAAQEMAAAFGVRARDLAASVGPHIRACCFQVGPEVSARFRPEAVREGGDGLFVDLGAEIAAQLAEAGVEPGSVAVCPECTSCRTDLFYSYRKDKARESLLSFLALTA